MKIEGLLWSEIQEIRIAVQNHKEKQWDDYAKMFKKRLTFEQIKKARKEFDSERNQWRIEGRCNKVLDIIQKQDTAIQEELNLDANQVEGEQ